MLRFSMTLLPALLLAACAGAPAAQRQQQRQADYEAAAGAPVRSFRFFTPIWSWEPLGNGELAVYTRPDKAWLLGTGGVCQNLAFTPVIGLTSNLGEVSINFDKVLVGRGYPPCTIRSIRPVDVATLKIRQASQRKVESEPRAPAPSH
jgi:hypothetical protein